MQNIVLKKNLTFQTENDLKTFGYDKTPDIKLDVPFAVDGFVVNWIEGKALFGDPEEHKHYITEQYSSYWNRYTFCVLKLLGITENYPNFLIFKDKIILHTQLFHRFGTGMVIYWMGMVDSVLDPSEKRFIVRYDFPQNITYTDPYIIAKIPKGVNIHLKSTYNEVDELVEENIDSKVT